MNGPKIGTAPRALESLVQELACRLARWALSSLSWERGLDQGNHVRHRHRAVLACWPMDRPGSWAAVAGTALPWGCGTERSSWGKRPQKPLGEASCPRYGMGMITPGRLSGGTGHALEGRP